MIRFKKCYPLHIFLDYNDMYLIVLNFKIFVYQLIVEMTKNSNSTKSIHKGSTLLFKI
jgi:hypothetical protein